MKCIVSAKNVEFSYVTNDSEGNEIRRKALDGLSLDIARGSYTAILGPNGSGKSTFAKLINVLEVPENGNVVVLGYDTKDEEGFWQIRENCACVFQNPDNQIVGTIVEEDVAFGPENLGVANPELRQRVDKALSDVGILDLAKRQTSSLSGGQKQKLAIAGALAMDPDVLILDESTAMLDPNSREEFLTVVERLQKEKNLTVITITHDMTEACRCDKIFVIKDGKVFMEGVPSEIFSDEYKVNQASLELPVHIKLTQEIAKSVGEHLEESQIRDEDTCIKTIMNIIRKANVSLASGEKPPRPVYSDKTLMRVNDISYSYEQGGKQVLHNIGFDIFEGEVLAIVGKSGCGKTTLISHMNALIRPQSGDVELYVGDKCYCTSNKKNIRIIRENVGLVFQYPEYQLFEETVYKDIAYGLRKTSLSEEEKRERIIEAIKAVGLDEKFLQSSPFDLSGGQKRRVAMAGVIVMRPKILVLDEPASGLDPKGRKDMFRLIANLRNNGTTIVLISHNMDEAAANADRIGCIKDGKIVGFGTPDELFDDEKKAQSMGIAIPKLYAFSARLKAEIKKVMPEFIPEESRRTPEEEAEAILRAFIAAKEAKNA